MEGEGEEEEEDEMNELEMRIEKAHLPEHALKAAQKELKVSLHTTVDCVRPSCSVTMMYTHTHTHTHTHTPCSVLSVLRVYLYSFRNTLSLGTYYIQEKVTAFIFIMVLECGAELLSSLCVCDCHSRNYLEVLLDLPWSSSTTDSLDLPTARDTLDADHYGLQPVSTPSHLFPLDPLSPSPSSISRSPSLSLYLSPLSPLPLSLYLHPLTSLSLYFTLPFSVSPPSPSLFLPSPPPPPPPPSSLLSSLYRFPFLSLSPLPLSSLSLPLSPSLSFPPSPSLSPLCLPCQVKKRVLEYLAVCKLTEGLKGPILCLVGAPGVGKTSIGRSIAKTLSRKFHRYGECGMEVWQYYSMRSEPYVRIVGYLWAVYVINQISEDTGMEIHVYT